MFSYLLFDHLVHRMDDAIGGLVVFSFDLRTVYSDFAIDDLYRELFSAQGFHVIAVLEVFEFSFTYYDMVLKDA